VHVRRRVPVALVRAARCGGGRGKARTAWRRPFDAPPDDRGQRQRSRLLAWHALHAHLTQRGPLRLVGMPARAGDAAAGRRLRSPLQGRIAVSQHQEAAVEGRRRGAHAGAAPRAQVLAMVNNPHYLYRMTVLVALAALAPAVSHDTLCQSMLPVVVSCAKDKARAAPRPRPTCTSPQFLLLPSTSRGWNKGPSACQHPRRLHASCRAL